MTELTQSFRTHTCGQLRSSDIGKAVTLTGWAHKRRDHGGLVFVDLRDRYGVIQVALNPQIDTSAHELAHSLRAEFVIKVQGKVSARPEGTVNPALATGEVEVYADKAWILNRSKTPPFVMDDGEAPGEAMKLEYRYLEIRRGPLARRLETRHKVCMAVRNYLDRYNFVEVETPMLTRSTPEGARDYLVPSRVNPGCFYALPQSPQLFKQLLMVGGMDRYFQIVRCFRDEDLRADRQPEFTQVDMEMSFVNEVDVQNVCEGMITRIFEKVMDTQLTPPFPRLSYDDAMNRFGNDRPDLRFGMELADISGLAGESDFQVFKSALSKGGTVRGISAPDCASLSRKQIDELTQRAITLGAGGLAWIKVTDEGFASPITKFFKPETLEKIKTATGASAGALMLFVADKPDVAFSVLGALRLELGERLNLIDHSEFNFVWIVDFPLFEYNAEEKRNVALHHPFTAPMEADKAMFDTEPLKMRARAYDLVLNGVEIGGGSIRIHDRETQNRMFGALGVGDEEAREKFGFLLDALEYGAPPHGGVAFGLDRLVAILTRTDSIRDTIAFPKTQKALCMLTKAPAEVDKKQLTELGLKKALS